MCDYCKKENPNNIFSINSPGLYFKIGISNKEFKMTLGGNDIKNNSITTRAEITYCPFCGDKL